jgi:tetratricopeptide (TPR) repeat protein
MTLGVVYIYTRRAAQGIAECEHALALDRNLAQAHANIGLGKNLIGRPEETESHIVEALRLSPRDTMASAWMFLAGNAKNQLGLWEQAAAWCQRAIEADRNFANSYIGLGTALARLGRLDEARSAVRAGLALRPSFSIAAARAFAEALSDNPTYRAGLEPLRESMRMAGVPEQ